MLKILQFGILAMGTIFPCSLYAQPLDIAAVLDRHGQTLQSVSSVSDTLTFFIKAFAESLPLPSSRRDTEKPSPLIIPEVQRRQISQLVAALAAIQNAQELRKRVQGVHPISLVAEQAEFLPGAYWLGTGPYKNDLAYLKRLWDTLAYFSVQADPAPRLPRFESFAAYLDQTYPSLTGTSGSWLAAFDQNGLPALEKRFQEFWETSPAPQIQPTPPIDERSRYSRKYFISRLMPVFSARLLAGAIRMQAMAEEEAHRTWGDLIRWSNTLAQSKDRARLCGTWQWTIHNHQNHQDHKMVLSFTLSPLSTTQNPQPDEVIIHGDTVYLKWVFSSGHQEDSLLFSQGDRRLEGTFKHSLGPHGNISGKRLTACRS